MKFDFEISRVDCKNYMLFRISTVYFYRKRYIRCGFICFMFGAVQSLVVLILTLLWSNVFNSVNVTELPPVWERVVNSLYHPVTLLFVKICLSIFPFDVLNKLWVS